MKTIKYKFQIFFAVVFFGVLELIDVYILYYLTDYLEGLGNDEQVNLIKIGIIFVLVITSQFFSRVLLIYFEFVFCNEFLKTKNNLNLTIFEQVLSLNLRCIPGIKKGFIFNLIQNDSDVFEQGAISIMNSFWIMTNFILSFTISFYILGTVFFVYIIVAFSLILVSYLFNSLEMMIEKNERLVADRRVSVLTNVFHNIRFIKLNGMENFFYKIIYTVREKQLILIFLKVFVFIIIIFLDCLTTPFAAIFLFAFYFLKYSAIGPSMFMALSKLIDTWKFLFMMIPITIAEYFKLFVSLARLSKLFKLKPLSQEYIFKKEGDIFKSENGRETVRIEEFIKQQRKQEEQKIKENKEDLEIEEDIDEVKNNKEIAIQIIEGNFQYIGETEAVELSTDSENEEENESKSQEDKNIEIIENLQEQQEEGEQTVTLIEDPVSIKKTEGNDFYLSNINLSIFKGDFILVIGRIASGKSSLFNAILGEMRVNSESRGKTKLLIDGKITYCPQNTFILSETIKDNVLFHSEFNKERYESALNLSCLSPDVERFADKDMKMVSEGGNNLSGGQKSRVGLARALYPDRDIYLLDNPFSSLDNATISKIAEETLVKHLKNKTRIIISNSPIFFKLVDKVLYMDSGKINFFGTVNNFMKLAIGLKTMTLPKPSSQLIQQKKVEQKKSAISIKKEARKISEIQIKEQTIRTSRTKDPEKMYQGRQLLGLLKLIARYYIGILIIPLTLTLHFFAKLLEYSAMVYFYNIGEKGIDSQTFFEDFKFYTILSLSNPVLNLIIVCILSYISLRVSRKLHSKMTFRALHADLLTFYDKDSTGRLINNFSRDIRQVDNEVLMKLDMVLMFLCITLFDVYVLFKSAGWPVIVVFILYYIVILRLQNRFVKVYKDVSRLEAQTRSPILSEAALLIEGRVNYKVFGCQKEALKIVEQKINEYSKNAYLIVSLHSWFRTKVYLLNIFIVELFTFGLTIFFLWQKQVSAKDASISLLYIFSMINNAEEFFVELSEFENVGVYIERCDGLTKIPLEKKYMNISEEKKFLSKNISKKSASEFLIKKKQITDNNPIMEEITDLNFYKTANQFKNNKELFNQGQIEFLNVEAKYPISTEMVIKGISFLIKPGEKLGIIGRTGSGKSSIVKVLTQYLEHASGSVTIDGVSVNKLDLKKLRSEMLVINQEITIFEGTLRDNLRLTKTDLKNPKTQQKKELEEHLINQSLITGTEKEIIEKLIHLGFSQNKLENDGLDLFIEVNGENLSAGEIQLISIFRPLFTKKRIVILDEATSNIDPTTEREVLNYLFDRLTHKTVLCIAHRLQSILKCDKVLALDNGKIIEFGETSVLLQNENSYFRNALNFEQSSN